jgi:hypothetical protein
MNVLDFQAIRGMSLYGRTVEARSEHLSIFLREHGLAEPKGVEYRPHSNCEMANCFRNVEAQVRRAKGHMETGWAFFELVNISIHTVAHAIWITPFGKPVDITPWPFPPKKRTLFLPDQQVAIKRGYTAGCRTIFTKDERIRAMELFEIELERIFDEFFVGMGEYMDIPQSRFTKAAERIGIPWEVAKERVDYAHRNYGH